MRFSIAPGATLKIIFSVLAVWFILMGLNLFLVGQMTEFLDGWPWSALCYVAGLVTGWLKLQWVTLGAREWMNRNHERSAHEVHD